MCIVIDFSPYLERKKEAIASTKFEIYYDTDECVWKAINGNNHWASDSYEELMSILGWDEVDLSEEEEEEDVIFYET